MTRLFSTHILSGALGGMPNAYVAATRSVDPGTLTVAFLWNGFKDVQGVNVKPSAKTTFIYVQPISILSQVIAKIKDQSWRQRKALREAEVRASARVYEDKSIIGGFCLHFRFCQPSSDSPINCIDMHWCILHIVIHAVWRSNDETFVYLIVKGSLAEKLPIYEQHRRVIESLRNSRVN